MPIYEYECRMCNYIFEFMKIGGGVSKAFCPMCGSWRLKRLISNTSFRLKGEGWADSGYSKEPKESKNEND